MQKIPVENPVEEITVHMEHKKKHGEEKRRLKQIYKDAALKIRDQFFSSTAARVNSL